jgi:hypothetical protein
MVYREIIAVCSEIHTKYINIPFGQNVEFVKVTRTGTQSKELALIRTVIICVYRRSFHISAQTFHYLHSQFKTVPRHFSSTAQSVRTPA